MIMKNSSASTFMQLIIISSLKTKKMQTIQKKLISVGKYINTDTTDAIIRTYKKERWVHNSKRLGKSDSLSVWHSVEELENFINNIKQHGADGIKFYFGAYSENYAPRPEYERLQTVILVATKTKQTENGISDKDVYITKNGSTEILAYNSGKLCPPLCGLMCPEFESKRTVIVDGKDGLAVI